MPCRFMDLAQLIEPGKDPKTDKLTVLTDAIRFIQQASACNHSFQIASVFRPQGLRSC